MEQLYYIQYGKLKELKKQGECFYIESDSSVDLSHLDNIKIYCDRYCNIKVGNNCYVVCGEHCNITCESECTILCKENCSIKTGDYNYIHTLDWCNIECDCRNNIKCYDHCNITCESECFITCDNFNRINSIHDMLIDCKKNNFIFDGDELISIEDNQYEIFIDLLGFKTIIRKIEFANYRSFKLENIDNGSSNFVFSNVKINNEKINNSQFTKIIFNIFDKFNEQLAQAITEKNITKILMLQNDNNKSLVKFLIAALHVDEIF